MVNQSLPAIPSEPQIVQLAAQARACRICRDNPFAGQPLPHVPRPVLQVSSTARICIAGQAPGTRVHASGRPFTDPSGDRLRTWLGLDEATFYDASRVAIVPMGLCFPGQDHRGADLPPRGECAATWHDRLFAAMPQIELILVIGRYAQAYHLPERKRQTITELVSDWRDVLQGSSHPKKLPLPHPSWRNNLWLKHNPWFERETIPHLRAMIDAMLGHRKRF